MKPNDKGKRKGSGFAKPSSQQSQSTTRFEGTCDNCGKYGHKKAECWSKQQQPSSSSKGDGRKGGDWKRDKGKGGGKGKGARSFDQAGEPDAEVDQLDMNTVTQSTQYFNIGCNDLTSNGMIDEWLKLNLDTWSSSFSLSLIHI